MTWRTVDNRWKLPLALGAVLIAAAVPAYAIADGIQSARTDRPDRAQLGQPRLPSAAAVVKDTPASLLRSRNVRVHPAGAAALAVPLGTPGLTRKRNERAQLLQP
jgi:hypothetical protein